MKNTLNFNKEIIIKKGRTIIRWVMEDHSPTHRGVRDMHGNIIDSPNKCLLLNSTDIENADNLDSLHDKAKSPDSLIPNGRKLSNGFHENYIDKNGKIYNVFLSKYTFEPLPIGFSEMQDRNIFIFGNVSSGKTLLSCMIIDKLQNLLNFRTINKTFSYGPAASRYDWMQQEYHYKNDILAIKDNEFPRATVIGDKMQKFPVRIELISNGIVKNKILNFVDLPGEYNGTLEDQFMNSCDCLWFLIDGENFLKNSSQTEACFYKYKNLLETFPLLNSVPTYVIVTKYDLLKEKLNTSSFDERLKTFLENNNSLKNLPSNTFSNASLVNSVHVPEFDTKKHLENTEFTEGLFKTFYPGFFNKYNRQNYYFMTVSSLSHVENGKIPARNLPFSIDGLLLATLKNMGLY